MHAALLCVPQRYLDCGSILEVCQEGVDQVLALTVGKRLFGYRRERLVCRLSVERPDPAWLSKCDRIDVELMDGRGQVIWWSLLGPSVWDAASLHVGMPIVLAADVKSGSDGYSLSRVVAVDAGDVGRVVPLYRRSAGVGSGAAVGEAVASALRNPQALVDAAASVLGASKLSERQLLDLVRDGCGVTYPTLLQWLRHLHRPKSLEQAADAKSAARVLNAWAIFAQHAAWCETATLSPETLECDKAGGAKAAASQLPPGGRVLTLVDVGCDPNAYVAELVGEILSRENCRVAVVAGCDDEAQRVGGAVRTRLLERGLNASVTWAPVGARVVLPASGVVCGSLGMLERARRCEWLADWVIFTVGCPKGRVANEYVIGLTTRLVDMRVRIGFGQVLPQLLCGGQLHLLDAERPIDWCELDRQKMALRDAIACGESVGVVYGELAQAEEVREGLSKWLGVDAVVVRAGGVLPTAGGARVFLMTPESFSSVPGMNVVVLRGARAWGGDRLAKVITQMMVEHFAGRVVADPNDRTCFFNPEVLSVCDGEISVEDMAFSVSKFRPHPCLLGAANRPKDLDVIRPLFWRYAKQISQPDVSLAQPDRQIVLL